MAVEAAIGILFGLVVVYAAGFLHGESCGIKDTERRWTEAVARKEDRT